MVLSPIIENSNQQDESSVIRKAPSVSNVASSSSQSKLGNMSNQASSSFESISQSRDSTSSSTFSSFGNDEIAEEQGRPSIVDASAECRVIETTAASKPESIRDTLRIGAESQVTSYSCYHDAVDSEIRREGFENETEECEFWQDEKYIEENFDLNFNSDNHQSPHLYLIGTAMNSVSNMRSYMRGEPGGDIQDKVLSVSAYSEALNHSSILSSLNDDPSTRRNVSESQFDYNHFNQINVDGFEWDLI